MTLRSLARLARANLRADRRGAILNAAAAAVGAAALVFFVALGLGVGAATRQLFPREARLLEVVPSSISLGTVLGGGGLIDDAVVERLRGLPEVVEAHPRLDLKVPVAAGRGPAGLGLSWPPSLTVQIPCVGVTRELVAADLPPGAPFGEPAPGEPVPAVLSRRLLAIYDRAIAPSWNLRRLPPARALIGLQLEVQVGFSIVPQKTEDRVFDARLVLAGISDRTPLHAAALPLEVVRRLNREYGKKDAGYAAVSLLVSRPEAVPGVAARLRGMGLAVEDGERALAERVGSAVALATTALATLALLMCGLAALAIAQSLLASVRARGREIALLLALGATPSGVRALFLAEALLTGAGGGLAGLLAARLAALCADALAHRLLPGATFLPETLFAFPAWLYPLGLGVAVVAAVAGAVAPAAVAARTDPARGLS